ncbi:MAG: hypothetical protein LBD31_04835 [Treponema sp.]|jgi:hypothetical protein|nr:hypothetical protein [Treponema sp.]
MEIGINGKPADITLEEEKTLGEVLAGIHNWLEGSGLYLSGLEVDGKSYGALSMEEAFALPLEGISAVDLKTSGWAELMLEALVSLRCRLTDQEGASASPWAEDPAALFLEKNAAGLYGMASKSLAGSLSAEAVLPVIAERIREIEKPREELAASMPLIDEIARRLEELPLDLQTGKDGRAAETVTIFSALGEKLYRLIFLFRQYGTDPEKIPVPSEDSPAANLKDYIEEFSAALRELIGAYENGDTVLVGDLAEYELAPRLLRLASILNGPKCNPNQGGNGR